MLKPTFSLSLGAATLLAIAAACSPLHTKTQGPVVQTGVSAPIFPDYADTLVLPPNIAPLDFRIQADSFSDGPYQIRLYVQSPSGMLLDSARQETKRFVRLKTSLWHDFLQKAASCGGSLLLDIYARGENRLLQYKRKTWRVASDSIDPYLVYRLNAHDDNPGGHLQIVQRSLSDFSQTVLMDNHLTDNSCMNCHASSNNDAHRMMVHLRGKYSGTLLFNDNEILKIALPLGYPDLRLAYPSWSSDGRFIAFASTRVGSRPYSNSFRTQDFLIDTLGRILIYDMAENRLFSSPELMDARCENTFPAWSPDGKTLYFCQSVLWDSLNQLPNEKTKWASFRYRLVSVSFDSQTSTFGEITEVFNLEKRSRSISMPSVNPDGNYILANSLLVGSYPSQNQGDFILLKREVHNGKETWREADASPLNSPDSERYHSWSSNGRWVVFDSKRFNGAMGLVFISYFDRNGHFSPPFVLPQYERDFYLKNTRSFIFPTLNRNSATFTAKEWADAVKQPAVAPDMRYFENYYRPGAFTPESGH